MAKILIVCVIVLSLAAQVCTQNNMIFYQL